MRQSLIEDTTRTAGSREADVDQTARVGVSVGYTTNAGPTLAEQASPVVETTAVFLRSEAASDGRVTLEADLTSREFVAENDARNVGYGFKASFDSDDGATAGSIGLRRSVELDEDVTVIIGGITLAGARPRFGWSPYIRGSIAFLDYTDIDAPFLEFANQDDRDRLSTTAEVGARMALDQNVEFTLAAGTDIKTYLTARDDFLIQRDNFSAFARAAIAYETEGFSATAAYSPIYRTYADDFFEPLVAHTVIAAAQWSPTDQLSLHARLRTGLEETDFLDAKLYEERVASVGLRYALPADAVVTLEAAHTVRRFDGVDRIDRKSEALWRIAMPIAQATEVAADLRYLKFATTFDDVATDQLTFVVGAVHAFN